MKITRSLFTIIRESGQSFVLSVAAKHDHGPNMIHGPHKHFNGENYINNVLYRELNALMHQYEDKMNKPHSRESMKFSLFQKSPNESKF